MSKLIKELKNIINEAKLLDNSEEKKTWVDGFNRIMKSLIRPFERRISSLNK